MRKDDLVITGPRHRLIIGSTDSFAGDLAMNTEISDEAGPERRRALVLRLRQMEIIEGLLEFDPTSLQLYADSVAEERQCLTQQTSGTASNGR
jgi:hypothetical protein